MDEAGRQAFFQQVELADLMDNMNIGVIILDSKGDYVYVNNVMVNMRNIPRNEFLKMNIHDFIPTLDSDSCVFDVSCREKRKVSRLQYYRRFNDDNSAWRLRLVTANPVFDENGRVKYVFETIQDVQEFEDRYRHLLTELEIQDRRSAPDGRKKDVRVIAKSPAYLQMLSVVEQIASLDSSVLLTGESGSGKEVIAQYIHRHGNRRNDAMITVNCAAFPENLIEAELFGYEKGSFTGANREGKKGLIEAADGGILFLDEINSLPKNVQGKLLRALEEKSVQRIGSTKTVKVDFRLLVATNRDLEEMVRAGSFREDLYYRLNVIPIRIPPVRERKEDILPLCEYFLEDFCRKYEIRKSFSEDVKKELLAYRWPGNVREIRNFVERMVVMTAKSVHEIRSIPSGMLSGQRNQAEDNVSGRRDYPDGRPDGISKELAPGFPTQRFPVSEISATGYLRDGDGSVVPTGIRGEPTREEVVMALLKAGNNREKAAQILGISRRTLQYKIRKYGLPTRRYPRGKAQEAEKTPAGQEADQTER